MVFLLYVDSYNGAGYTLQRVEMYAVKIETPLKLQCQKRYILITVSLNY